MVKEGKEFTREVLRLAGQEVLSCFQCGTCSASCPTAHLMRPSIRRLVKLCLEGKKAEALSADAIWLCTSCQLCTVRCPRGIRPKMVVSALKDLVEREGIKGKDEAYEELFMRQIRDYGRIAEIPLSGEFLLAFPQGAVQAMELGLELAPKGKVVLRTEKIKRPEEVKRIIEELGR